MGKEKEMSEVKELSFERAKRKPKFQTKIVRSKKEKEKLLKEKDKKNKPKFKEVKKTKVVDADFEKTFGEKAKDKFKQIKKNLINLPKKPLPTGAGPALAASIILEPKKAGKGSTLIDKKAGGGKVGSKFFTGGMVNPSYGTEFDDR